MLKITKELLEELHKYQNKTGVKNPKLRINFEWAAMNGMDFTECKDHYLVIETESKVEIVYVVQDYNIKDFRFEALAKNYNH